MSYSEHERRAALQVLKANDGNITQTGRELNIASSTLRRWRDTADMEPKTTADDDTLLRDNLLHSAHNLAQAIPQKIGDATLHQVANALKIVLDKVAAMDDAEGDGASAPGITIQIAGVEEDESEQ